jgi:altronate dehydratase
MQYQFLRKNANFHQDYAQLLIRLIIKPKRRPNMTTILIFCGCGLACEIVLVYLKQKRFNQRIDKITLNLEEADKDLKEILDSLKDINERVTETAIEVTNIP